MRMTLLALIAAATVFTGCSSSRTRIMTLELPRENRAALVLDSGSPRVTVNNFGPATVLVRFEQSGGTASGARVPRGGKVARDVDTPGKVVVESGPEGGAKVTCVIERMSSLVIEPPAPK